MVEERGENGNGIALLSVHVQLSSPVREMSEIPKGVGVSYNYS